MDEVIGRCYPCARAMKKPWPLRLVLLTSHLNVLRSRATESVAGESQDVVTKTWVSR